MNFQDPADAPLVKIEPMPAAIAKAIIAVMAEIGVLAHNEYNKHNEYAYASVDAFLTATNPLCAKHGLIILPLQRGVEREQVENHGKLLNVMNFHFQFMLAHASGATWTCAEDIRTVRLLWSGAQTSGMAQSYAQKQYMRGLFQIATGDKDADAEERIADEAPGKIRQLHKDRKDTGKKPSSRIVHLDFGVGSTPHVVDDLEQQFVDYFAGSDSLGRKQWRAKKVNAEGMEAINGLDKTLWLRLVRIIEDGVKV